MIQVEFSIPIRSAMVIRVLTISNLFCFLFHLGRNDYRSSFQSRDTIKEVGDLNFATLGLYKALSLQANQIALSDKTKV